MVNKKKGCSLSNIKLLVSDIDGTIVNEKCECSSRMRAALNTLKEKGIKIVLATGRMFDGADGVRKDLGLDTPVICYQGAMVRKGDDILWQSPVNINLAKELINLSRERNFHLNLYNDDTLIVENDDKKIMEDYTKGRFTTYKAVRSFDEVKLNNISKLLCITYDEQELLRLQDEFSEKFKGKLAVVRSHKHYLEFTDINATKGNAMKYLADLWGIKKEEIMASGDQDNDYELLLNAGIKVAMGNASKKLKSVADYICPPVESDGLVEAIERYILCA